jgi:hypothetical protein
MFKLFVLLAAAASVSSCAFADNRVLKRSDVANFSIVELPGPPSGRLRLAGLAFHSALAVQKITEKAEGETIFIFVHLTSASKGRSGSFTHDILIPQNVNKLAFGEEGVVVWRRGGSD